MIAAKDQEEEAQRLHPVSGGYPELSAKCRADPILQGKNQSLYEEKQTQHERQSPYIYLHQCSHSVALAMVIITTIWPIDNYISGTIKVSPAKGRCFH